MPEPLRRVPPTTLVTGWDFSTGSVKCLAFDLAGNVVAEERYPTELWAEGGVSVMTWISLAAFPLLLLIRSPKKRSGADAEAPHAVAD